MAHTKSKQTSLKLIPGMEYFLLGGFLTTVPVGASLDHEKALEVIRHWMNRPDNRDTTAFVEMMAEINGLIQE
jgi:hypothetical protein